MDKSLFEVSARRNRNPISITQLKDVFVLNVGEIQLDECEPGGLNQAAEINRNRFAILIRHFGYDETNESRCLQPIWEDIFPPEMVCAKTEVISSILNHNLGEYKRINCRINELRKNNESADAKKLAQYLEDVRFNFEEWFRQNKSQDYFDNKKHKRIRSKKSINYNLLYSKILNSVIKYHYQKQALPNQEQIAKAVEKSPATISRILSKRVNLGALIVLYTAFSKKISIHEAEILHEWMDPFIRRFEKLVRGGMLKRSKEKPKDPIQLDDMQSTREMKIEAYDNSTYEMDEDNI